MSQPWLAGASSLGGCIGKMLSPQSIALGIGAVGAVAEGKEGEVMRGTVGYCLFMLVIAGIITIIAPSVVPFLVNQANRKRHIADVIKVCWHIHVAYLFL